MSLSPEKSPPTGLFSLGILLFVKILFHIFFNLDLLGVERALCEVLNHFGQNPWRNILSILSGRSSEMRSFCCSCYRLATLLLGLLRKIYGIVTQNNSKIKSLLHITCAGCTDGRKWTDWRKWNLQTCSLEPPFRNFILPKKHIYYYHIIYVVLFSSRLKDNETNYDETSVVKRASKIRNNTLLLMHGSGYVLLHLSKIVHLFSIKRHSRSDVRQSASEPTKAAFSLSFLVKW